MPNACLVVIALALAPAAAKAQAEELEIPVNALLVPDGRYAGTVALTDGPARRQICSAVMLSPTWALTMAHCVSRSQPARLGILHGETDLKNAKSAAIRRVILEPGASDERGHAGEKMALLELDAPVLVPPLRFAAAAPESGKTASAVVAGWGTLTEKIGDFSARKQYHLAVSVVAREVCNSPAIYAGQVSPTMLCARSEAEGFDVCQGFGGAPLMTAGSDGRFLLVGLVSWGEGCARKDRPTVYSTVFSRRQWIESVIGTPVGEPPAAGFAPILRPGFLRASYAQAMPPDPPVQGRAAMATVAPDGAYRFMVSIGTADRPPPEGHFCGGVLISSRWVATAAHCVEAYKSDPGQIRLKLDGHELARPSIFASAVRILPHPDYHRTPHGNFRHDIALIEIDAVVPGDLRMARFVDEAVERQLLQRRNTATVVGWGLQAFSEYASVSNFLHNTTVTVVANDDCNSSYQGLIDDNQMCAGLKGADACQGDSGGPLLIWDDREGYLVLGLVSWGKGCGIKKFPGVYSKVSAYRQWLGEAMAPTVDAHLAISSKRGR